MSEPFNARIASTFLGIESHGIPTASIRLQWGGGMQQSFGGYDLRYFGIEFVIRLVKVAGADSWEDLPGSYVRIVHTPVGSPSPIAKVGHIIRDEWFDPDELAAERGAPR